MLVFTHAFIPVIFLSFFCLLTFKNKYLVQILLVILCIYLVVTIFYATVYLPIYIKTFEQSIHGFGTEYITTLSKSLREPESVISQIISFSNRISVPLIWILGAIGSIVLFFKNKINFFLISLGLASGIYLTVGILYPILGLRAAQFLLIPITIGFMFFIFKWKKPTIIIVVIILVLAVFGPMRMAYNQTQFQLDEEANACDFLVNNIINGKPPKFAMGQVNWGYFVNKHSYLKNIFPLAIRPGETNFLDTFNGSLNKNDYVLYNSNLGKEILTHELTREQLDSKLKQIMYNNKIYECGGTFIIKGINTPN